MIRLWCPENYIAQRKYHETAIKQSLVQNRSLIVITPFVEYWRWCPSDHITTFWSEYRKCNGTAQPSWIALVGMLTHNVSSEQSPSTTSLWLRTLRSRNGYGTAVRTFQTMWLISTWTAWGKGQEVSTLERKCRHFDGFIFIRLTRTSSIWINFCFSVQWVLNPSHQKHYWIVHANLNSLSLHR